ncbi:hypothetical protein ACFOHT_00555 [Massilia oculi]|uniref:hypothetical protein n=1 Tax=Massilia oculi TaxID=945844 RepID=UPI003619F933
MRRSPSRGTKLAVLATRVQVEWPSLASGVSAQGCISHMSPPTILSFGERMMKSPTGPMAQAPRPTGLQVDVAVSGSFALRTAEPSVALLASDR